MTFQPGTYYVGDPGFVLANDDLRGLFAESMRGLLKPGFRIILATSHNPEYYWVALTPDRQGTIYDENNNGWGFDWGCFGIVPWKWIESKSSYESNKIDFTEPFECSFTEDSITIGHLHFTFNPK